MKESQRRESRQRSPKVAGCLEAEEHTRCFANVSRHRQQVRYRSHHDHRLSAMK